MTTLVLGGTGPVGSAVVQELLKRGESVRVATRSEEKVKTLPQGVQGVVGDLIEPSTYGTMFSGVERLFLLNAVSLSEAQEGLVALNEAKKADIQRIVYLSIHNVETGPYIPHFANKLLVEKGLEATKKELKEVERLLEHPPRSFASFVAETAESWR